ncbi:hypothetical protein [Siphonobacter sp. SORGH_AS_1065]|uniref:hypothetical protein n=1 Tax=Siphonobacter sp. SORGH_AS_1065 TaxID=3041795 RepID=UPI002788F1BE|nr:hypothetical protein [Siphonobacter sp. SORGH_AS_1065]MDQ1089022.1 hypothetical protein [Siphonobacter sp. SORGH_AS_1065]
MEALQSTRTPVTIDNEILQEQVIKALKLLGFSTYSSYKVLSASIYDKTGLETPNKEQIASSYAKLVPPTAAWDTIHLLVKFDEQPEVQATYNSKINLLYLQSFDSSEEFISILLKNLVIRDFINPKKLEAYLAKNPYVYK